MLVDCGVPVFFLISGFLLFRRPMNYRENIQKKIKTLLIPYFFWMLLWIVVLERGRLTEWTGWDWLRNVVGIPFFYTPFYAALWYVRDLFLLNLIAPVFEWGLKRPKVCGALFLLVWLMPWNESFYYLIVSITFFGLGGVLAKINLKSRERYMEAAVLAVLGALAALAGMDTAYGNRIGVLFLIPYLYTIAGISELEKLCGFIKKHIFIIYVTHHKLVAAAAAIMAGAISQSIGIAFAEYFVIVIGAVMAGIIFSVIFKKIFPSLYGISTGGR